MNDAKNQTNPNETATIPTKELRWGEMPDDNVGYASKEERLEKRGLEDWEMVEHMANTEQGIPYWFFAIFIVLLLVAVGLTFPFWGNRPGYERDWWDWGIPAGMTWVIVMSVTIYYFVDGRDQAIKRKAEKESGKQDEEVEEEIRP